MSKPCWHVRATAQQTNRAINDSIVWKIQRDAGNRTRICRSMPGGAPTQSTGVERASLAASQHRAQQPTSTLMDPGGARGPSQGKAFLDVKSNDQHSSACFSLLQLPSSSVRDPPSFMGSWAWHWHARTFGFKEIFAKIPGKTTTQMQGPCNTPIPFHLTLILLYSI